MPTSRCPRAPCGRSVLARSMPRRCRRSLSHSWFSALCLRQFLLADQGVDAGDLAPDLSDLGVVVELAGGVAEAQVERFVLRLAQLLLEFLDALVGEVVLACH